MPRSPRFATRPAARSSLALPPRRSGAPDPDATTASRLPPAAVVAAGLAAYLAALVATLPARLVAPPARDAAGTAWHGSMAVGPAAGAVLRWDASLPASLAAGGAAARWTVDGPATALTGTARWRPLAGADATAVAGRAGWGMIAALAQGLPPECDIMVDVAFDRVAAGDVRGRVTSLPGTCGGGRRTIPRLVATFTGARGRVAPWSEPAVTYATIALFPHLVRVDVTAAGATALPGPGRAGSIEVEL